MTTTTVKAGDKILDASLELFIRHGFRRTTMGDIAEKAEMSRPALYVVYRNKEDIFRAVVTRYGEELERQAGQRVAACKNLAEMLEAVFKTWVTEPYKLVSRSPEANELHEIGFSFGEDLRKQMSSRFEKQLLEILKNSPEVNADSLAVAGTDIKSIAALIACSTPQLKRTVGSCAELERHLATLLQITLVALTGGGS